MALRAPSREDFWARVPLGAQVVLCLAARDSPMCGLSFQEDTERTQINVLAVQAITSLVLSAMTVPVAGNPAVSCLEQQPRSKPLKALDTRCARIAVCLQGAAVCDARGAPPPTQGDQLLHPSPCLCC